MCRSTGFEKWQDKDGNFIPIQPTVRRLMHAWMTCSRDGDKTRPLLRDLIAIEVGDTKFNKEALLSEERFREIYDSIINEEDLGEDAEFSSSPPITYQKNPDLEWAA